MAYLTLLYLGSLDNETETETEKGRKMDGGLMAEL